MNQEIPFEQLALIAVVGIAFIRVAPALLNLAVRTVILLALALMGGLWLLYSYLLS